MYSDALIISLGFGDGLIVPETIIEIMYTVGLCINVTEWFKIRDSYSKPSIQKNKWRYDNIYWIVIFFPAWTNILITFSELKSRSKNSRNKFKVMRSVITISAGFSWDFQSILPLEFTIQR